MKKLFFSFLISTLITTQTNASPETQSTSDKATEKQSEFKDSSDIQTTFNRSSQKYNPRFNIRIEPIWLVLSDAVFDFQVRIGNHFTVGPVLGYTSNYDGLRYGGYVANRLFYVDKTERATYGVRAVWHKNGVNQHGLFVSSSTLYYDNKIKSEGDSFFSVNTNETARFNESSVSANVGYKWSWSFFNLNIGGGLISYSTPKSIVFKDSNDEIYLYNSEVQNNLSVNVDFGVGFAF